MRRQQVRPGAPDAALTPNAGMAVISELCDRLGVIEALDAAVGPIKQRDRGFGAVELLTGIAAAQLAGEDFLTRLDRQRADAAGQRITPVPGLAGSITTREAPNLPMTRCGMVLPRTATFFDRPTLPSPSLMAFSTAGGTSLALPYP